MDEKKRRKKRKRIVLISVILLLIAVPVLLVIFNAVDTTDTIDIPAGLEVEESIDLSYNQWTSGVQLPYTGVFDRGDGIIRVGDANVGAMAKASLKFNAIDIGKLKMQMSASRNISQNYFAMEFRDGGNILFKLERRVGMFTLVVLDNIPLIVVDLEAEWRTVEIFFDLSDSGNNIVSVDLDGVNIIGEFTFDPNSNKIDNIYMHTSTDIYRSQTDIKFEYLYNFK